MKSICLILLFLVLIIVGLLISGLNTFGNLPISQEYPTWGDFSSIITSIITIIGAILLYKQIKIEIDKNKIQHYQNLISKLPIILNSISHDCKLGSEAIIAYCKNLNSNFGQHPRVLIGKISYIEVTIRNLIKDLNQNKKSINKEILEALIVEILMFYYTNIYFCIITPEKNNEDNETNNNNNNESDKNLMDYLKCEEKHYKILIDNLDDLNHFCYKFLRKTDIVDLHKESNEDSNHSKFHNTDYKDLSDYID